MSSSRLILALFAAAPLVAIAAGDEVAAIRYRVSVHASSDIAELLEKHLELYKWQGDKRVSAEQLARLVDTAPERIRALLATEGYFKPEIRIDQNGEADKPHIQLYVAEGEPVRVTSVSIALAGDIENNAESLQRLRGRLAEAWPLPVGERFRQAQWDQAKREALDRLQVRDYPTASIVGSLADIDPEQGTAALTLTLNSGPAYVYGPILIEGLQRYPEQLVSNHIRFQEGDTYRRRDLLGLQTELQNQAQFASVLINADYPETPPYAAPVHVRVEEAPLHKWGFGVGFTTNTGFRTAVDYRYLNLFNQGWVFAGKVNLEQREQSYNVNVGLPRDEWGYDLSGYADLVRSDIAGLDSHSYTAGITRSKQEFTLDQTLALEYQTEQRQGDGIDQRPQALTVNYIWKSREIDSIRDPRDGELLQFEAGGGAKSLLSDTDFLRLYGRAVRYLKLNSEQLLIGRLELGQTFTHAPELVPSDWLFRAGGSNSVRGYTYQSLGIQSGGATFPARVLATAAIEFQQQVYKDWRAAVFADYGGAQDSWSALDPVAGVGVGARWISPVGTLGADLAYGLEPRKWRISLAMGLAL
ncbi:autotransporter assembly complex protein TamA [Chitinilyticum litopenaei]|uniref:autotransporter assembly complex protein TamA n=1 Tax=Chitinilyticum litopenaei TaxID=1121276 RepID=UPI00041586C9|nr:autotransporter assembly complex family protein [Chitinilyticum litopenaei]